MTMRGGHDDEGAAMTMGLRVRPDRVRLVDTVTESGGEARVTGQPAAVPAHPRHLQAHSCHYPSAGGSRYSGLAR